MHTRARTHASRMRIHMRERTHACTHARTPHTRAPLQINLLSKYVQVPGRAPTRSSLRCLPLSLLPQLQPQPLLMLGTPSAPVCCSPSAYTLITFDCSICFKSWIRSCIYSSFPTEQFGTKNLVCYLRSVNYRILCRERHVSYHKCTNSELPSVFKP